MKIKNDQFIPVGNSKTVTVTTTFIVDEMAGDEVIARNAADILFFWANTAPHQLKSFVKTIEIV